MGSDCISSLQFSVSPSLSLQCLTNDFISLFSGTARPIKLKHGTHLDNRLMLCVYRNQPANICPFISSFFFPFSNNKTLCHNFLKN